MAKVYDIVNRLKNEKPIIKLTEDRSFQVHTSKNSAILIKGIAEDKDIDDLKRIDMIIEAGLGKEALDIVNELELSIPEMTVIINAIMAAISDIELEEMEKLADEEGKKQRKK